ncbi:MAG: TonB-dependent receptor [Bacteroidales bacterium]|nr:TonB-dependent receptor [Bacteroidales bacterium]
MSYKKRILFFLCLLLASLPAWAQSEIHGRVSDSGGNPVPGAVVMVAGSRSGEITDTDGRYTIRARSEDVLEFSCFGMKTQKVKVGSRTLIDITLEDDYAALDEAVVVGYGTQKRQSITGAVSQVSGDKIAKAPAQTVTNMMGGVIPGVISYQASGVPGGDGSTLLVRGSGVKAIVDGVERSISDLDPNEIESISVLKDASATAIYGFDSGAVMIITTKRGDNKDSRVNYKGSMTVSSNAMNLELLDGPGFAKWYNLARVMDGDDPVFTQEQVDAMLNGDDSDGWGNTNWYKEVFGKGITQSHSLSVTGGTDKINYFATIGYYNQEGNVKGYSHNRINLRSNIEAKVGKNVTLEVGLTGRFTTTVRPGLSADPDEANHIGIMLMRVHPYVPKTYKGVMTATYTGSEVNNVAGYLDGSAGYGNSYANVFEGNASLRYDAPFLEGLSAKAMVAYDVHNSFYKNVAKPFQVMVATLPTSVDESTGPMLGISYKQVQGFKWLSQQSTTSGYGLTDNIVANFSVDFNRSFGLHDVGAMALMELRHREYKSVGGVGYGYDIPALDDISFATDKTNSIASGSSSHYKAMGYVYRLTYSYDNRYLAELSGRVDGLYTFYGSTKPWGFFPAASIGWRIDKERWFDAPAIDMLKIRYGTGIQGSSSGVAAYTYADQFNLSKAVAIIGGQAVSALSTDAPGDPDLTWSKTWSNNLGVDLNMFNGRLRFEGDVFYKYLYDLIGSNSGSYPASWGGRFPSYVNSNKQDHRGFDFLLAWRDRKQDFSYGVEVVGSHTYRRWLYYGGDAANWPDYWKATGKEVGAVIGFVALGLFRSEDEIANSPTIEGTQAMVGDIKYLDRNGDGKITYSQDMGYVGKSVYPKYEGGLNLDFGWKGFDLTLRWTYAFGRDVALTGVYTSSGSAGIQDNTAYTKAFYHGGNSARFLVENMWLDPVAAAQFGIEVDNSKARFPRLSLNPTNNNAYSSTWWYQNGNYLRLKNFQLGYTVPAKVVRKAGFSSCRVYIEGTNLLTFSALTKYNIDPEMPSVNNGYYPQQKLMGFGVDVSF